MRWLIAAAALAAVLTGCGGTDAEGNSAPGEIKPHYVNLPDNRQVLCVWEKSGYGGGLSCDWSTAQ
ncbi:hypotheical protein [Mycobacterium phage PP]|uniref:Hypotheical protein n=1 Tax=Mycobacterium phage PP TaxID=2077134 RepID=A0A2Z5XVI0_9CAUD|nr:hypothetical protein KIW36_gp31 [Mycobacterium phage PP]BBC53860.1 hypotheical protein [Mycobacterium phage PP]